MFSKMMFSTCASALVSAVGTTPDRVARRLQESEHALSWSYFGEKANLDACETQKLADVGQIYIDHNIVDSPLEYVQQMAEGTRWLSPENKDYFNIDERTADKIIDNIRDDKILGDDVFKAFENYTGAKTANTFDYLVDNPRAVDMINKRAADEAAEKAAKSARHAAEEAARAAKHEKQTAVNEWLQGLSDRSYDDLIKTIDDELMRVDGHNDATTLIKFKQELCECKPENYEAGDIISDVDNMVNFYKTLNNVLDTNVFDANIIAARAQNQELDVVSELFAEETPVESLVENVAVGTENIDVPVNVDIANFDIPQVDMPQLDMLEMPDFNMSNVLGNTNFDMGDAVQDMANTFDMSGVTDALQEGVQNIAENFTL